MAAIIRTQLKSHSSNHPTADVPLPKEQNETCTVSIRLLILEKWSWSLDFIALHRKEEPPNTAQLQHLQRTVWVLQCNQAGYLLWWVIAMAKSDKLPFQLQEKMAPIFQTRWSLAQRCHSVFLAAFRIPILMRLTSQWQQSSRMLCCFSPSISLFFPAKNSMQRNLHHWHNNEGWRGNEIISWKYFSGFCWMMQLLKLNANWMLKIWLLKKY